MSNVCASTPPGGATHATPATVTDRPDGGHPPLRFAVFGAGAVGTYYGALLARAGFTVTLIGRPDHVAAIQAHGVQLLTAEGSMHIAVAARTEAAAVADADVVLVCVKSGDTEAAARAIAAHLTPQAVVLSLQNGVDNAALLSRILGRPAVPVAVYVAVGLEGPGVVRHHGRGDLVLAPFPQAPQVLAALAAAGIPAAVSDAVPQALWTKLVINCAYNALSAITARPYGWLWAQDGVPALLQQVVRECVAVAAAEGIVLDAAALDTQVQHIAHSMATQRSSTAHDLLRGRRTEIDHLNGAVVARARAHGLSAPANQTLHTLVRLLEHGRGA
ncbi:ketopantoate reductase family protein [Tepidimonas charontis]|uniref:2-dehydropantoate 2-reductase n=1 Tax=Tepidimonas charontis TaxID=2267262 RepID=A0A554XDL2_9BURK|nr:ketopantoate reductase family protein [Tepidimonas charontis]TSE33925.1 2-dehydropantoate 2-reductase [Tepidimonas charontis]